MAVEPGWYPDPTDPGRERYWSGRGWSDETRPGSADATVVRPATAPVPTVPGPPVAPDPPPPGGPANLARGAPVPPPPAPPGIPPVPAPGRTPPALIAALVALAVVVIGAAVLVVDALNDDELAADPPTTPATTASTTTTLPTTTTASTTTATPTTASTTASTTIATTTTIRPTTTIGRPLDTGPCPAAATTAIRGRVGGGEPLGLRFQDETDSYAATVCASADDLFYVGGRKRDGSSIVLFADESVDGWVATNEGTTYVVGSCGLTIALPVPPGEVYEPWWGGCR